MDRIIGYRHAIREVLTQLAGSREPSIHRQVETSCVFDETSDQYLIIALGWEQSERINNPMVHVRLRSGKVWIEENLTEARVGNLLMEAGVPREDIVLGFQPPEMRQYTEFAAG